jgi:hypothetical protein
MVLSRDSSLVARVASAALIVLACASCAATGRHAVTAEVPSVPLVGEGGEIFDARAVAGSARLTVFVFFSPDCRCLTVHEPRLRALFERDRFRGVQFFMVDSEVGGSLGRDAAEARQRGYPFPILLDRGGELADALDAKYASYAVVFDSSARVRYRGGIDSDRTHLHDQATNYLADAVDDLLADREPRVAEGKTLGCALQRW